MEVMWDKHPEIRVPYIVDLAWTAFYYYENCLYLITL